MNEYLYDLARARQEDLVREAATERLLRSRRDEYFRLRDRLLLKMGGWLIALGRRLQDATECATQNLSQSEV